MVPTIQASPRRDGVRDSRQATVRSEGVADGPGVLRGAVGGAAAKGLRSAPETDTEAREG